LMAIVSSPPANSDLASTPNRREYSDFPASPEAGQGVDHYWNKGHPNIG